MTTVWLGALLLIAGVVYMAAQPLWRGRLSGLGRPRPGAPVDTLEPAKPAGGFGLKANWPGLALVAAGAVLLLVGAAT
ncbi:MAG TPA: hypothetical protein VF601_22010 [Beijerinckiaceae bacterium]|jgi:hypothetical protein